MVVNKEGNLDMRGQFEVTSEPLGDNPEANKKWGSQFWCKVTYVSTTGILILMVMFVLRPLVADTARKHFPYSTFSRNDSTPTCIDGCKLSLFEADPTCDNNFVPHQTNHDVWLKLIASARSSIDIMTFKFSDTKNICSQVNSSENEGSLAALVAAGRDRGVRLRIILYDRSPGVDAEYLAEKANAQVRRLKLIPFFGKGVMHSKLLLIDRTHFYIGSANMDQLSVDFLADLGLVASNCSCFANDVAKIFDGYWALPEDGIAPNTWPESLATRINIDNPMLLTSDGIEYRTFAATAPAEMLANGRTHDLDALLYSINKAEKFIDVATVKYFPLLSSKPNMRYWPIIENALREAAIVRKVHIRLLVNRWEDSSPPTKHFLKSLTDLTGSYEDVKIEAKFFSYPVMKKTYIAPQGKRYRILMHHRYIVTETMAYITSNNLAGDYFDSAGIGLILEDVGHNNTNSIRQQLKDLFQRDWTSRYAYSVDTELPNARNSSSQDNQ